MDERSLRVLEGSRRVGWAKYFEAADEVESLRKALRLLADAVIFHPRIHTQDEILDLARECQGL